MHDRGSLVDGSEGERFQVRTGLLAICKVHINGPHVQWNSWLFETLVRGNEPAKLTAEER